MIQVKIFGTTPPCARCKEMERRAKEAAAGYPGVEVAKFDALSEEGDRYGVMLTPTVVINDRVVAVGKLLSEEEIAKYIAKELEAAS
jgi:protein-disulfide isomerase